MIRLNKGKGKYLNLSEGDLIANKEWKLNKITELKEFDLVAYELEHERTGTKPSYALSPCLS
jgi:hypothetical protein